MKDPIIIEPYNDNWQFIYFEQRSRIVSQIGSFIQRIDHIGSTAVVGLAAKPIIDIQISVSDLDDIVEIRNGLSAIGFHQRFDNQDLSKRYFRETPGMRRTHGAGEVKHVRMIGRCHILNTK